MIVENVKKDGFCGIRTVEELETALRKLGVHMDVEANGEASVWVGSENDYGDAPGRRFGLCAVLQEFRKGEKVKG